LFTADGFPVANFQIKSPGIDAVPFELGGFPLTEEDFDILPGVDALAPASNHFRVFGLKKLPANAETFVIGKIEVSLSNASVWDYEKDFDCVVARPAPREMIKAFLPPPLIRDYIENLDWFMNRPFRSFLEEADLEKWSSVGIGIDLDNQFKTALTVIKKWKSEFPKRVHFFIIDPEAKQRASEMLMRCT